MNKHTPIKPPASLLERANELYDFGAALRGPAQEATPVAQPASPSVAEPEAAKAPVAPVAAPAVAPVPPQPVVRPTPAQAKPRAHIDRDALRAANYIDPEGPVTGLSEEFRIVKRQLLLAARGGKGFDAIEHGERILICSANPNEGKTFCAVNLALSMATEKDNRVLLVDADFAKPSVLARLGIEGGRGLMDALADPSIDVEDLVIETDVAGLSVLPAGAQTNQDTEYLAAARTAAVLDQLTRHDPARIIIFDSPPALAASPASVLALHVGQAVMVVHADVTTDSALRDALSLLSGCENIQLLLNRAKFSPTGRKFGNYYGYGA
ncbi:MAG: AAA family ATPase [Sphingomonadales bacterium]|jgi:protein-tyrosine kinase|nr:AAA family ATPase [Sphingomonadales bacterium]MBK9004231.1 AAA family ATPase [Sphingomonadales bacterium]MBK9269408.1 AAA family ATPase [Sphingomonadales bacterium]MBP6434289.1 AAA family ATPase [Sphingorhabdus sp.]